MRIFTSVAIAAISIGLTTSATAQMAKNGNPTGAMPAMSAADQRAMTRCQAMTHDKMMKSTRCKHLMEMHPEAMSHDEMPAASMPDGSMQGGAMNHNGAPAGSTPHP